MKNEHWMKLNVWWTWVVTHTHTHSYVCKCRNGKHIQRITRDYWVVPTCSYMFEWVVYGQIVLCNKQAVFEMTHVWATIIWSSHHLMVGTMIHEPIALMVNFNDRTIVPSKLPVLTGTGGRGCLFYGSQAGVSRDMPMIKHEGVTIFLCQMPSLHMSETCCSQCSQSMPWGDFSLNLNAFS